MSLLTTVFILFPRLSTLLCDQPLIYVSMLFRSTNRLPIALKLSHKARCLFGLVEGEVFFFSRERGRKFWFELRFETHWTCSSVSSSLNFFHLLKEHGGLKLFVTFLETVGRVKILRHCSHGTDRDLASFNFLCWDKESQEALMSNYNRNQTLTLLHKLLWFPNFFGCLTSTSK